ncbi:MULTISPECIES: hypothetical protein [Ralstonia]|jgi:hypothetical protein|uniref:hypothetical protein n=1 Tax=Ralstonia TaxID=48736 RepID=UPI00187CFF89|nr:MULTISPECIES: hypothetical protein [Ralstonia]MBL4778553.1 hypothetical protein [Ralstonia sp.]MCM3579737.1 hypothetical protein [Ralstonia pickettii]MDR9385194.1 hypothetical protein [Ralstonia sp. 11b]MEA3268274.1 hypothetical protein [Pseudomonadota bacterium]
MHTPLHENILKIEAAIFTTSDKEKLNAAQRRKIWPGNFPGIQRGVALQQLTAHRLHGVILPDETDAVRGFSQNRYARKVCEVFSVFRRAIHAIRVR